MLLLLLSQANINPLLCMEHSKRRMCPSIKNGTSEGEGSPQVPLGSEIISLKSPRESWGVTSEERVPLRYMDLGNIIETTGHGPVAGVWTGVL